MPATPKHRVSGSTRQFSKLQTKQHNARLRLSYELLESRHLLAADISPLEFNDQVQHSEPIAPLSWSESLSTIQRIPLSSLADIDPRLPMNVVGPLPLAAGEWIVQLSNAAIDAVRSFSDVESLLNDGNSRFAIVEGLGSDGLILVRGEGASRSDIETSLTNNDSVERFTINQLISGQATVPDDPDFSARQSSLTRIGLPTAWDQTIGDLSTVVGVLDTGIDLTHPDLYLNIWLNQGEIPPQFLVNDAQGKKLVDIDNDGLITFYDLNNVTRATTAPYDLIFGGIANGPNAKFVIDKIESTGVGNGRIDASDILADNRWANGRDNDGNKETDDFFGVNFRGGEARNNPTDQHGHGTHVAGTIGAIGNNNRGVVGVNWETSLMALRILDQNREGDTGSAIKAVNYARDMRERFRKNSDGRVTAGANVRVLNNSWGQTGGFEATLETAIKESGDAGILFVAAAGNGNFLGKGVDNDKTQFYPASYDLPNVITVASSTDDDSLASSSNYGFQSVDVAAPGTSIYSTKRGGDYETLNGTSMATPHVAGTAALIWSAFPEATVAEVRTAILSTVDHVLSLEGKVVTEGRLNAFAALNADVFAPAATIIAKQNITTTGGATTEFKVRYSHRNGIAAATIGNDDLVVNRQWGPTEPLRVTLKAGSIRQTATTATATYIFAAPGGAWDALDYGDYIVSTVAGKVLSKTTNKAIESREIGSFAVRVSNDPLIVGSDPSIIYVDKTFDSLETGTLRSAITAANAAAPAGRTIILNSSKYLLSIPPTIDAVSTFPADPDNPQNAGGWSTAGTGDLDIQGNVTIIGDMNNETQIDGQGLDRVFKVHPNATLKLSRLTVQGGVSPHNQGGGGILSAGALTLEQVIVRKNTAVGSSLTNPIGGGGVSAWAGTALIDQTWLTENVGDLGGALYFGGTSTGMVQRSTLDSNEGGALLSNSVGSVGIENSTFSANAGGNGAITSGPLGADGDVYQSSLSADGRFVAFTSFASNLVIGDTNNSLDVFVYDRTTKEIERISVNDAGIQANEQSANPSISADGRYVAFESNANNLVPFDTNDTTDVFVYDRNLKTVERVSLTFGGQEANFSSDSPSISADGRFVAFSSTANLVSSFLNLSDIYVYDRVTDHLQSITKSNFGRNTLHFNNRPSISANGRYVAFESSDPSLVVGDNNDNSDIFVYDRLSNSVICASVNDTSAVGDFGSTLPALSANGKVVTFKSEATNLVPNDTNEEEDVFVFDIDTKVISRISVSNSGVEANFGTRNSSEPSISENGRYVAFTSFASNLVPNDTNPATDDIFLVDRVTNTIKIVNISDAGVQGAGFSFSPSLSSNGQLIAYISGANDIVAGDRNTTDDAFIYDRNLQLVEVVAGRHGDINVANSTVAFTSQSDNAVTYAATVSESLFFGNSVLDEFSGPGAGNVHLADTEVNLVSPLTRVGFSPPVHFPLLGNVAINSGNPNGENSLDQLGQVRQMPDVGAIEATTATAEGKAFVDSNRNGRFDLGEAVLSGFAIDASMLLGSGSPTVSRRVVTSIDDKTTPNIDESGRFLFDFLQPGQYAFSGVPQEAWKLSIPSVEILRKKENANNGTSNNATISADGRYIAFDSAANNLVGGDTNGRDDVFVYDRQTGTIERVSVSSTGIQGDSDSRSPSISADGRFIAFESVASNLVLGDANGMNDIFVFDRETKTTAAVSVNSSGPAGSLGVSAPSISADGRYVAFSSFANNLVAGDTNATSDVFVFDRLATQMKRVSVNNSGVEGNGLSYVPSISADGRYVAFTSRANNLVVGDTNNHLDAFVYDNFFNTIQRISISNSASQGNSDSYVDSISANGRFVSFTSDADNLVLNDQNANYDIFVYDLTGHKIERVSINDTGDEANNSSFYSSISADGRYVAFESGASNLVANSSSLRGVYVYDRLEGRISKSDVSDLVIQGNGQSFAPAISGDGHFVAFTSDSTNLVRNDANQRSDIFVSPNRLVPPSLVLSFQAGELRTSVDIGFVPDRGTISGKVFEDTVANSVFDLGESVLKNVTVYVDLNGNRKFDDKEPTVLTDENGDYKFSDIDSYRSYSINIKNPIGYETVIPNASEKFAWNLFLPAGGELSGLDFSLRRSTATGQSSDSSVRGRVLTDNNGNGIVDAGDTPVSGITVYFDGGKLGNRDLDDSAEVTDANGFYSFTALPSTLTPVRLLLDDTSVQLSPVGNDLLGSNSLPLKFPLGDVEKRSGNPQSLVTGFFNSGDSFPDVAVLLAETNTLSIRLNDQLGGFSTAQKFDFNLSNFALEQGAAIPFANPNAMVTGQFDTDPKPDFAITGNFTSNVMVLLNFDTTTSSFSSIKLIAVGQEPQDIVIGQFAGNVALDLVVLNKGDAGVANDETVQILTNDGSGVFIAGTKVITGGKEPVSLVAGNFMGSAATDIAVTHSAPRNTGTTAGGVTLLAGDGAGGLSYNGNYYPVQAYPFDSAVGDFNNDQRPDLAVVNFGSTSISILLGQADGTLRVQTTVLGTVDGAIDIAVGDIENDGDVDIITTKLTKRQVSIFRNLGVNSSTQEVVFEPQENIGLGAFQIGERMPFALVNVDKDISGPLGTGTLDIIAVPQNSDTLYVLPNRLVQGSRRVSVSGASTDIASGIDFLIRPAAVSFDIAAVSSFKAEGQSLTTPTTFTFKVTRSGRTTGTSTVNYAVTGTTANRATAADFIGNAFPSGTLTFAPGVLSQLITINVVGDSLVEPTEGFLVSLSAPSAPATITTGTATGSILNDDTSFAIAATSAVKSEGQSTSATPFTFTITRSGVTTGIGTVNYAVTGSSSNPAVASDFLGNLFPKGTVVFAAGVTSQVVTISVVGDALVEFNESFIVTLSAPSLPATITTASAIGTIQNDDTTFAIAATSAVKLEGQSPTVLTPFTFTVTRSGATTATSTVKYAVTGSGANPVTASDFAGNVLPSGTVTFAPGVTSQLITLNVIGDSIVELNEGLVVSLHTPSAPATITTSTAIGTVQNDDTAFAIAAASAVKSEGQSLATPTPFTFTVTRSGLTTGASTVNYAVTGSTLNPANATDFVGNAFPSGTVTFAPGVPSREITIDVVGDSLVESDEGFVVTLNTPSLPATISTASAIGTIQNDDTSFAIAATVPSKPEGQSLTAATPFTFTVTRSGVTTGRSTVNYAVTGTGSDPANAADFLGNVLPSGTIAFAAGQTSKLITINVVGDSVVEANERFAVTLNTPSAPATITTAVALGAIENDDIGLAISAASASKSEGQSLITPTAYTFTVTRTGLKTGISTVKYAVTGSGANPASASDFLGNVLPSGIVVFEPGSSRQVITINVIGDSVVEQSEGFIVTLTAPSSPATIITASALGTILNDDTSFAIAATSAVKAEGNGGGVVAFTFTVTRSGLTTGTGSVKYAVTGSTSSPATSSDFQGNILPSGTVIFAVNEVSKVITINVLSDSLKELAEGFVVTLNTPVSGAITMGTASGTIQNDD